MSETPRRIVAKLSPRQQCRHASNVERMTQEVMEMAFLLQIAAGFSPERLTIAPLYLEQAHYFVANQYAIRKTNGGPE